MTNSADPTYTVVTCHFGDLFWIRHTLEQIDRFSGAEVLEVIVVDQSRDSAEELAQLPRVSQVLSFPFDEDLAHYLGHDHPSSLNRALHSISFATSHVLIIDSDCFPLSPAWLEGLPEVTIASDPHYLSLAHPCFMSFPVSYAPHLDFAEGIKELSFDTGRLVALQLVKLGVQVNFTRPIAAFNGYRGHFCLEGRAYHHGSASFGANDHPYIKVQVNSRRDAFFRSKVEAGDFDLTRRDVAYIKSTGISRRLNAAKSRIFG